MARAKKEPGEMNSEIGNTEVPAADVPLEPIVIDIEANHIRGTTQIVAAETQNQTCDCGDGHELVEGDIKTYARSGAKRMRAQKSNPACVRKLLKLK